MKKVRFGMVLSVLACLSLCSACTDGAVTGINQNEAENENDDRTDMQTQDMVTTENAAEGNVKEADMQQPDMTLEEYGESLLKCQIEGVQYQYKPDENFENAYVTEGLKGVGGCVAYTVEDFDADGEEELLVFQMEENPETGNDIYAQVYENTETGIQLMDEELLAGSVLGLLCDSAEIRFMLKDKTYICLDYRLHTFLAADGVSLGMRMFTYDGTKMQEYLTDDVAGSDFYESGRYHSETLQKLRDVHMEKTAENLELRDNYSFCMADAGVDVLAKIYVENSYSYTDFSEQTALPVATCHLLQGRDTAEEFILPESAESYLTKEELSNLDAGQLRIARNEIYARYGWHFDDEGLRTYFENQPWYAGGSGSSIEEEQLSEIERANRDLIQSMEKQ